MMDDKLARMRDVTAAIKREREYLISRNQPGAEHIIVKHFDAIMDSIPAVDAVEVVRCRKCRLHGICSTEDVFRFAGLSEENQYCGVGKRREDVSDA